MALRLLRALGLTGFLGGLAALSALWAFGPRARTPEEWGVLIEAMRSIFYACFFAGILILIPVGVALWWPRRRALRGQRWFRVLWIGIVIAVPSLHISARLTALALYAALESGDLTLATALWDRLGMLFVAGFVIMGALAAVAIVKPRLGESTH